MGQIFEDLVPTHHAPNKDEVLRAASVMHIKDAGLFASNGLADLHELTG
jgi:hypothetical protein